MNETNPLLPELTWDDPSGARQACLAAWDAGWPGAKIFAAGAARPGRSARICAIRRRWRPIPDGGIGVGLADSMGLDRQR